MMEWLQLLLPAWTMGTLLVFLTAPLGFTALARCDVFSLFIGGDFMGTA